MGVISGVRGRPRDSRPRAGPEGSAGGQPQLPKAKAKARLRGYPPHSLKEPGSALALTQMDSLTLHSSLSFLGLNVLICKMENLGPWFFKAFFIAKRL